MPSFRNGKVEIAYLDEGEGEPIVLIHGFASTKEVNWLLTSWFATLTWICVPHRVTPGFSSNSAMLVRISIRRS